MTSFFFFFFFLPGGGGCAAGKQLDQHPRQAKPGFLPLCLPWGTASCWGHTVTRCRMRLKRLLTINPAEHGTFSFSQQWWPLPAAIALSGGGRRCRLLAAACSETCRVKNSPWFCKSPCAQGGAATAANPEKPRENIFCWENAQRQAATPHPVYPCISLFHILSNSEFAAACQEQELTQGAICHGPLPGIFLLPSPLILWEIKVFSGIHTSIVHQVFALEGI